MEFIAKQFTHCDSLPEQPIIYQRTAFAELPSETKHAIGHRAKHRHIRARVDKSRYAAHVSGWIRAVFE